MPEVEGREWTQCTELALSRKEVRGEKNKEDHARWEGAVFLICYILNRMILGKLEVTKYFRTHNLTGSS